MDRPYITVCVYAIVFAVLFATALTPLMRGLIDFGLDTTAAALLAWFTVILVPAVPAWLVKDA